MTCILENRAARIFIGQRGGNTGPSGAAYQALGVGQIELLICNPCKNTRLYLRDGTLKAGLLPARAAECVEDNVSTI
jgi:hypothetical protein